MVDLPYVELSDLSIFQYSLCRVVLMVEARFNADLQTCLAFSTRSVESF